jgi:OTU-like cysteine protease
MFQLSIRHLQAVDVCGDGNCFFRALSVCIHGHQDNHSSLRKLIASYVSKQSDAVHPADRAALRRRAQEVAADKFWPGEDIVLAASDCLQRPILVYVAHNTSSPIQYLPSSSINTLPAISIAFLEPGHYVAVTSAPNVHHSISAASKNSADLSAMTDSSVFTFQG